MAKHERNEISCVFGIYNVDRISSEEKLMYNTHRSRPVAEQNSFVLPQGLLVTECMYIYVYVYIYVYKISHVVET